MKTADAQTNKSTKFKGYKSFEYLEPGTDYREFKLAKELDRVPSRKVEVSDAQEERVWRVLDENLAVSLHDHCFIVPEDFGDLADYRRQGRDFTGYAGMARSGLDAVFDCLMDGTATITSKSGWKWDDIIFDLGMRMGDIAHQEFVVRGESLDDIKLAKENGQIAFIASLEAATSIENEVDRLDILYGLGIRSSGIAYSEANTLGGGLREARDGGLTDFGRLAVRRMNKLGIAIDGPSFANLNASVLERPRPVAAGVPLAPRARHGAGIRLDLQRLPSAVSGAAVRCRDRRRTRKTTVDV